MAARGLWSTTDLAPLLAERGITLSATQVYRLVVQTPERLSLRTLMALCDALQCTSTDLIEPVAEAPPTRRRKRASGDVSEGEVRLLRPKRARIVPDP
jgi:DNA-binding Xre family transcriptional regulator